MADVDSVKHPSLPSNYVSISQLQERWLKEKQRKQQEKEKQEKKHRENPIRQNHQNHIGNGSILSQAPVGKNLHKCENHSAKVWREVGLIAKEPKSKEVKITAPMVEEGVDGTRGKNKKKKRYYGKTKPRVERDGAGDMAKVSTIGVVGEEITTVVSVKKGGKELSKGKFQWNGENKEVREVATVCMVEVVGENKVDREIAGQRCKVGFKGKKNSRRRMGDGVGEVSHKGDSVEQSGQEHNAEKEVVSVDVKEITNEKVRMRGAFCAYFDKEVKEVATICTVEVVGENKVDRKIIGQKCRIGFRRKKNSRRKMGDRIGEVSDKADSVEQSGQEHNAKKEEVSVDVKERTNENVRVKGVFRAYVDKSKDASLIDSEAGLKMKIERDLGELSLSDRSHGHQRSSVRVYSDKWRCGSSRRYEPRKTLKQRDNSFVWVKKGESSNYNVAEIETQVDFSSESTKSK